jgi:hypothetical protein
MESEITESSQIACQLYAAIQSSFDALNYSNAQFLAERLCAHLDNREDSLYCLAKCYFLQGNPKVVAEILKSSESLACRYLYARACLDSDQLCEAEFALLHGIDGNGQVILKLETFGKWREGAANPIEFLNTSNHLNILSN